jgi:hypothetical protein
MVFIKTQLSDWNNQVYILHLFQHYTMYINLKKIKIVFFILVSFSLRVSAPSVKMLNVLDMGPVEPYKQLAFAVGMVETKGDTLAYNPKEEALGIFQIRPIRLIDYNKRTVSNYTRKDLLDYKISEKIFLYYADQLGPYNLELIAKKWNGSGHLTTNYWFRIKQYL